MRVRTQLVLFIHPPPHPHSPLLTRPSHKNAVRLLHKLCNMNCTKQCLTSNVSLTRIAVCTLTSKIPTCSYCNPFCRQCDHTQAMMTQTTSSPLLLSLLIMTPTKTIRSSHSKPGFLPYMTVRPFFPYHFFVLWPFFFVVYLWFHSMDQAKEGLPLNSPLFA